MRYIEVKGLGWMADPKDWEELKWTLHNEKGIKKTDPTVKYSLGLELLARFG